MSDRAEPIQIVIEPGRLAARLIDHTVDTGPNRAPAWTWVSDGFARSGQPEIVLTVLKSKQAGSPPTFPIALIKTLQERFAGGLELMAGQLVGFESNLVPGPFKGLALVKPEGLDGVQLVDKALAGVLLTGRETSIAFEVGLGRVLARLGAQARWFPCPYWCDLTRRDAVGDGHLQKSLLARMPKIPLVSATVLMRSGAVVFSIPDAARGAVEPVRRLPANRPIALVMCAPNPDANAILVWEPGQRQPDAISQPGGNGERLGGNFIAFVPDGKVDELRLHEDGFALLLRVESWMSLRDALLEGRTFELPTSGAATLFQLRWTETIVERVHVMAELTGVKFMTPESEARDVAASELVEFIQRVGDAVNAALDAFPASPGAGLALQIRLGEPKRLQITMAGTAALESTQMRAIYEVISTLEPPNIGRPIAFDAEYALWGGPAEHAAYYVWSPSHVRTADEPLDDTDSQLVYRSGPTVDVASITPGNPYGAGRAQGIAESADPTWIEPYHNPFGMRVLDCRPITHKHVSVTSSQEIADRFASLRHASGNEHVGTAPPGAQVFRCELVYPTLVMSHGPVFRASAMEDKWDIFFFDGYLYFARSWSGNLILRARVEAADELRVTAVEGPSDGRRDGVNTPLSVIDVDFLIKSHLFRQEIPHGVPLEIPNDPSTVATWSMSAFGRWASFATYGDPTSYDPWR